MTASPRIASEELSISGAHLFTPAVHSDHRGEFLEWFRADWLCGRVGHRLEVPQANSVVSRRGALRGIHLMSVPPGQAKYVTCVAGAVLDVVVDVRVGSPTFGCWNSVVLDDSLRRGVYLAEGLGHALMGLSEWSTVVYLCSAPYGAASEIAVDPFDPELAIDWPDGIEPVLSSKDAGALSLRRARREGLLPDWRECRTRYDELRGA